MKIDFPKIFNAVSTQPAGATIVSPNAARVEVSISYISGGPFYLKRGSAAVAQGGGTPNWDYVIQSAGDAITIANYIGTITCDPAPTAGQINVADGLTTLTTGQY